MLELEHASRKELEQDFLNHTKALIPGMYRPHNSKYKSKCSNNTPNFSFKTVFCGAGPVRCSSKTSKYERAVLKNGEINVHRKHFIKCFSNCFLALVEARWRWTLVFFFLSFTGNWLLFASIYWSISYTHGDFQETRLPYNSNTTKFTPCIENINGFTSTFLFSIEIHTTVAYGRRSITLECPQAIIAMCLQCIVSSIFQSVMVGILFAKLTRPRARTQTILFSKHSVIAIRDTKFCLIFRVGDIRKSRILNIKPTLYVLKWDTCYDHLQISKQIELKVEIVECESIFFLWPVHVVHIIDEGSPFYSMSAADLLCSKIELLAVFEGIIESTGQPVQALTSFTESDILWGQHFLPMITHINDRLKFNADFSKLSDVEQVETPLCSANEYQTIISSLLHDVT